MDRRLTLVEIQRIKQWHVRHKQDHPLEYQVWDLVLCLWLMGWGGWLPVLILGLPMFAPLCLLACCLPRLYVSWRARAHHGRRLRCDWLASRS